MALVPYLLVLLVIFWLFMIRPQQRRAQEARKLQAELGVGNQVMLTSGIFGRVADVDEDAIHVEVADGVTIRVLRAAIARIIPPDEPETPETPENTGNTDSTETPELEPGDEAGPKENEN